MTSGWPPLLSDDPALMEVSTFLGISRCAAFRRTCRSTMNLPTAPLAQFHSICANSLSETCLAPKALLNVFGSPSFSKTCGMEVEDCIYSVVTCKGLKERIPELLSASDNKSMHEIVDMIAELKPKCKVSPDALDVLLQPRVERGKMLALNARPLHYAIIHNSARAVRMMLNLSSREHGMENLLEKSRLDNSASLSLVFLAALFADIEIAEALKVAGATLGPSDKEAAMRLKRAGLWQQLKVRLGHIGFSAEAELFDSQLNEQESKLASIRQLAREKAAAALSKAVAARSVSNEA